jgi:anoctamin-10
MTVEDILTPADKQVVIKYALDDIKAQADERHIPGYSASFLYHGQSIIHAAISEELIVNMYSLHDKEYVKRLGAEWWNLKRISQPQPIERIRQYFGDAIGIYFSFVGEKHFQFLYRISNVQWPSVISMLIDESLYHHHEQDSTHTL